MVTSMHIDPNKMVTIKIDGIPVTVPSGTTIMEAARKIGIKIPSLCHHPDLGVRAFCRVCLVEDSHSRRLKTACNNLVDEAGDITTNSPKVRKARKTILELILANHPQDCLHCEKNGKCELQTLAAEYNIRGNIFDPVWKPVPKEMSNPALVREMVYASPVYFDLLLDNGLQIRDTLARPGGHYGYRTYVTENQVGSDITNLQLKMLKETSATIEL